MMLLKISQNSQENICARVTFLISFNQKTLFKKRMKPQILKTRLPFISGHTYVVPLTGGFQIYWNNDSITDFLMIYQQMLTMLGLVLYEESGRLG